MLNKIILLTVILIKTHSNSYSAELIFPSMYNYPCKGFKSDYYNLGDSYNFAIKIIRAVRSKNLDRLFSFVNGELKNGTLTKEYIKNKKFEDIFSKSWILDVLKYKPSCTPVGYRGFELGKGKIWYDYDTESNKWYITAINDATNDESLINSKWNIDNLTLTSKCFIYEWLSSDNFEEFSKKYNLSKNQLNNIGLYLGSQIPLEDSFNFYDKKLSLTIDLDNCSIDSISNDQNIISNSESIDYTVIENIPKALYTKLAPNIYKYCKSMKLIHMKTEQSTGIFGYFILDNGKKIILPLKYFNGINDARNYIDNMVDNNSN